MAKSKLIKANEKITEGVTSGFQKREDGVVGGYKKIEAGVVSAYKKVEDSFVDKFLAREGESAEEAKRRLSEEQAARGKRTKNAAGTRTADHPVDGTDIVRASIEASQARGRASIEASQNAEK